MKKLLIPLAIACLIVQGCATYKHERFSDSGQPIELTSVNGFFSKQAFEKLKTSTKEKRGTNTYSRTVGVDSVEARVDAEGVQAVESTVGKLLIEGIKASSGAGALIPSK